MGVLHMPLSCLDFREYCSEIMQHDAYCISSANILPIIFSMILLKNRLTRHWPPSTFWGGGGASDSPSPTQEQMIVKRLATRRWKTFDETLSKNLQNFENDVTYHVKLRWNVKLGNFHVTHEPRMKPTLLVPARNTVNQHGFYRRFWTSILWYNVCYQWHIGYLMTKSKHFYANQNIFKIHIYFDLH